MSETVVQPNNIKISSREKVSKERAMPWTGQSFAEKHNHSLNKGEAKKAAKQATAIVENGGDEGMAIAVANRQINKLRKSGKISDRMHEKRTKKYEEAEAK